MKRNPTHLKIGYSSLYQSYNCRDAGIGNWVEGTSRNPVQNEEYEWFAKKARNDKTLNYVSYGCVFVCLRLPGSIQNHF